MKKGIILGFIGGLVVLAMLAWHPLQLVSNNSANRSRNNGVFQVDLSGANNDTTFAIYAGDLIGFARGVFIATDPTHTPGDTIYELRFQEKLSNPRDNRTDRNAVAGSIDSWSDFDTLFLDAETAFKQYFNIPVTDSVRIVAISFAGTSSGSDYQGELKLQ